MFTSAFFKQGKMHALARKREGGFTFFSYQKKCIFAAKIEKSINLVASV